MASSNAFGIGASQLIGMAAGMGVVVATFGGLAWLNRRSRIQRDERPPQRSKILRPPGYSSHRRIDDLAEQWNLAFAQAIFAGAILGMLCTSVYPLIEGLLLRRFTFAEVRAAPNAYIFVSIGALTVAALAWLIASVLRAHRLRGDLRNWKFGLRGEQAVAEALANRALASAGYITFHDVPGDGAWNIDHVVIGPGGIIVLETKTRSRRKPTRNQPDHEVLFDGRSLQFPWWVDYDAVSQVKRNAEWITRFISGFAPKDMIVQPVIVVPGWYVKTEGSFSVKAMNAKYLVENYLPSFARRLTPDQLEAVIRRLDERCRDLEF